MPPPVETSLVLCEFCRQVGKNTQKINKNSAFTFERKRQQEWCSRFDTMNLNNGGVAAFPTSPVTTTCESDIIFLLPSLPLLLVLCPSDMFYKKS